MKNATVWTAILLVSTLLVEDAVTLGTPHDGSGWSWGCGDEQCIEMRPGSAFLAWSLALHA